MEPAPGDFVLLTPYLFLFVEKMSEDRVDAFHSLLSLPVQGQIKCISCLHCPVINGVTQELDLVSQIRCLRILYGRWVEDEIYPVICAVRPGQVITLPHPIHETGQAGQAVNPTDDSFGFILLRCRYQLFIRKQADLYSFGRDGA